MALQTPNSSSGTLSAAARSGSTDFAVSFSNVSLSFDDMQGAALLRDPSFNQGLAYSEEARKALNLEGHLPAAEQDLDVEVARVKAQMSLYTTNLQKHIFLNTLSQLNTTLFYRVLIDNLEEAMPLVYTPTVGEACVKRSLITRNMPQGIYVTAKHKGQMLDLLKAVPGTVDLIVVTDGSRILGLGDLGANGMGIPVGKLALYVAAGGLHPSHTLPVTLDFGTDNEAILEDPFYIGARHPRIHGDEYMALVDEFVAAVQARWPHCLIQFEDFTNDHAFPILDKYQDEVLCFNDDIQGTGAVIAAGFVVAARELGKKISDLKCVFLGAGSAGVGVADRIVSLMVEEGLTEEEARRQFWFLDSRGLITTHRDMETLAEHKVPYARDDCEPIRDLVDVVKHVQPDAIVGLSKQPGVFNEEILSYMAEHCEHPLVFPLSNPTSKSECTAEDAYTFTNGACLFASGSPFAPVEFNGQTFVPGQGNNMFIFPGLGLGAVLARASRVTEGMINAALKTLAAYVTEEDIAMGRIYPAVSGIRAISARIGAAVISRAVEDGVSTVKLPESFEELVETVQSRMYDPSYSRL